MTLHCHHQNDFHVKMGSDTSHIKKNLGPSAYQLNALPLGQADSQNLGPSAHNLSALPLGQAGSHNLGPYAFHSSALSLGHAGSQKQTWVCQRTSRAPYH